MDGASMAAMVLQLDDTYDTSKLIKFNPIPLWRRNVLRAMVPFNLAKLFY